MCKQCEQSSGQLAWWYQRQASGLMGSPTVPRMRRLAREYFVTKLSPKLIRLRMAVGAVYKVVTYKYGYFVILT